MDRITWDNPGDRLYEVGLDRGVLYPANDLGVAWNGLTSVLDQQISKTSTPLYYDGKKVFDIVKAGDFSAKINAITYPEEFLRFTGFMETAPGVYLDNQPVDQFGLSYRTLIGDGLDGSDHGYKLHFLYNLSAVPDDVTYQSMGNNVAPIEFAWTVSSVPNTVRGYHPTGHVVLYSNRVDPDFLSSVEDMLYGSEYNVPILPRIEDLM